MARYDGPLSSLNPFSPTAVARPASDDNYSTTVTVQTSAVTAAVGYLQAYLADDRPAEQRLPTDRLGPGNVVAVVGDYGTGKTHLAVEVFRHAKTHTDKEAHTSYIEAEPTDFVDLYKAFVRSIQLSDLLGRVREFYQDVVVEQLESSELTKSLAELLRSGRDLDLQQVVTEVGLDDAALVGPLRRKLAGITANPILSSALLLLLRPGFEDAVWKWFQGEPPAEILQERGVEDQILTDDSALEAMGVVALLYGRHNHRLMLVIDEIEHVVMRTGQPSNLHALQSFKKMLTVFSEAGAFVLLVGLPAVLESLPRDVLDRIGPVLHMPPLTLEQTRQLIVETQHAVGLQGLLPFTEESVAVVHGLTNGNPRRIIRLCHHSFSRATELGQQVDIDIVREAALEHVKVFATDEIRRRVRTILRAEGLVHTGGYVFEGPPSRPLVDEWVHVAGSDNFGIIVSDSVVTDADSDALHQRALAIQAARPGTSVLLIINGYITQPVADQLAVAFNQQPLIFDPRSFDQDLTMTMRAMALQADSGDPVADVTTDEQQAASASAMAQVSRQQTNLYLSIEELGARLDGLRQLTERRFEVVQGEIGGITGHLAGDAATTEAPADAPPGRLPTAVSRVFTGARATLADYLRRVDDGLRQVFTLSASTDVAGYRRALVQFRSALRSERTALAVSALTLAQQLVARFEETVSDWYRGHGTDSRGRVLKADEQQLRALCGAYDAVYEYIPIFEVQGLGEFTESQSMPEFDHPARFSRASDLQEVLDGLGARVQRAMLEALAVA